MFPQIKNLRELMTRFSDDATCRAYLEELVWNGDPVCPHCSHKKPYKLKDCKTYRCGVRSCKKDFSVTVRLIFENSKIPLAKWFAAIYLLMAHKKGISSVQLAKDLGLTQKTAWFMCHRICEVFTIPADTQLTEIVETDETYVGGKWDNMHNSKRKKLRESGIDNKIPVMGMVQRGGKVCLKVIGHADSFKDVVHRYVRTNAIVVTDAHKSYKGLDETYKGHMIVNHSEDEYKVDIYHTNTIEGFFSILKRGIFGIYHHVSPKHLHRYCEEFSYRYNSRKIKDAERFIFTLQNMQGRLKYHDLTSNPVPKKLRA